MKFLDFVSGIFNLKPNRKNDTHANAGSASPPFLPSLTRPDPNVIPAFFHPLFWSSKDHETVTDCAKKIVSLGEGGYHFGDNFLTWGKNISMLDDQHFVQAWESNVECAADETIGWRRYVLACAAHHCVQLEGDFVECGAYTGVGIKTVMDYLGGTQFPKTFWGFDAFEHSASMLNHAMPEHGPELYDRVKNKFKAYPQVKIVKGLIPDVFKSGCPGRIAYLHIDMNQATAEVAALDTLFEKIVPGGILILDDYEWAGIYRDQKIAEDQWLQERGYRVIPLPTGQGLVIKR